MRKVLTHSSTAFESVQSHRPGSHDVSASSSLADPVTHPQPVLLRYSNRPTFGISLNELKAAIAPRAEHFSGSLDEADRSTFFLVRFLHLVSLLKTHLYVFYLHK